MTRLVVLLAGSAVLFAAIAGPREPQRAEIARERAPEPRWSASKRPLSPLPVERESRLWHIEPPRSGMKAYPALPPVLHLAYRDGGEILRTLHTNGELYEHNTRTRQPVRRTLLEFGANEQIVAVSADGRLLATATETGVCRVWDTSHTTARFQLAENLHVPLAEVRRGRYPVPQLEPPKRDVNAVLVNFACHNRRMIARTGDGTRLAVYDVETGTVLHTTATPRPADCATLSPDGNTLFANVPDALDEFYGHAHSQAIWAYDCNTGEAKRIAETGCPVFPPGASGTTVNAIHTLGNSDSLAVIVSQHELLNIGWPGREPLRTEHFAWIVSRREPGHSQPAKFVPRSARDTFRLPHANGVAISADGRWLHSAGRLCDLSTGERRGHLMGWDMLSAFRADGEEIAFSYAGHGAVLFFPRADWSNVKVETD